MPNSISPEVVEFVLSKINDGFLFERFAKNILAKLRGVEFAPVGGIHDKGIDGLEYVFTPAKQERYIYQCSIEKGAKAKLGRTILALNKNNIELKRLYYVTNQRVKDRVNIEEELSEAHDISVQIWDVDWFGIHINDNSASTEAFVAFQNSYLHEYQKPGKAYEVLDLAHDPRVFVFLRQQWDVSRKESSLDEVLADSLILFALEGTDPDKKLFRTRTEILERITTLTNFDPKWLHSAIEKRLKVLSAKPLRRIRHHRKEDLFCLPYETRVEIQLRNLSDTALYETFCKEAQNQIDTKLREYNITLVDPYKLYEEIFHRLFKQQGLEFSNFLETGDGSLSVEKSLQAIIQGVVEDRGVTDKSRHAVIDVLQQAVRQTIYGGTQEQLAFLRKLADTYRLLFLLQIDPQIATYFASMVSKLRIYVDTSIIIPALSEYFLEKRHRRHWNLLVSARDAGVKLIINDVIVTELASHFRRIRQTYRERFLQSDAQYVDDIAVLYVDDILIRAYFYAKLNGQVESFDDYLGNFVSLDMRNAGDELIIWLNEAFGIQYEERANLKLNIDLQEEQRLYEELKKHKPSVEQARNDARQLLTIYAIREANNERSLNGIYGYSTWWLTTDTMSQKAFESVWGKKVDLRNSPYIRADFLYNHITLAPSKNQVDDVFRNVFPTVIGVNISYHIPSDIRNSIQKYIKEHSELIDSPRLKAILRDLTHKLKSDPAAWTKERVELYLDSQRKQFSKSDGKS